LGPRFTAESEPFTNAARAGNFTADQVFKPPTMHCGRFFSGTILLALGAAGWCGAVPAEPPVAGNPYAVITNRNAFAIRPPPDPEPVAPPAPPAVPPNIFLTGVTHQGSVKKAFFVINRPGAKAPDYETAVEGDVFQDLKVLEINAREGRVKVNVGGREMILNFADNALKANAAPAIPPAAGRPGQGGVPQPAVPLPGTGSGSGPVVIGRGGVNLNANSGGVPAPVIYPGQASETGGGVVLANPPQPLTRSLPARANAPAAPAQDQVQPALDAGGRLAIPVPPVSRFDP
jgi:hypothetical protein